MKYLIMVAMLSACATEPNSTELAPNQIVAGQVGQAMFSNGSFLFYVDATATSSLRLMRVRPDGTMPTVLASFQMGYVDPRTIVTFCVDTANIFLAVGGQILSVPITGGNPVTLVDDSASGLSIQALVADASNVYWLEGPYGYSSRLMRVAKTGGASSVLAQKASSMLAVDIVQIAVDSTTVYWPQSSTPPPSEPFAYTDDLISGTAIDGSSTATFATNQSAATAIVINAGTLFWIDDGDADSEGSIMSLVPSAASAPSQVIANLSSPTSLRADNAEIFWLDQTGVHAINLNNGVESTLASSDVAITGFALDSSAVYWSTASGIFAAARQY